MKIIRRHALDITLVLSALGIAFLETAPRIKP